MPDWFTHTLVGWITGKTIKMDVSIVVIGSLIPDIYKIKLAFTWLGIEDYNFFDPITTPIGALLIAGIFTLLFKDIKKTFFALAIGIITHIILDSLLVHPIGGMKLLYPLSREEWHFNLIRADDYRITIITALAAIFLYILYYYLNKNVNIMEKIDTNNEHKKKE
jgi:membrane-bound metal-dependent hydrolase YbcI (DUF457 family)